MVIIIIGIIFIIDGSMNILFVKNIIHLIDLPAITDIVPRSIVGIMIFICSLIYINEFDRFGPHRTIKLNRIE
jgi:hypothetical protein